MMRKTGMIYASTKKGIMASKYKAIRTECGGIVFDSKREALRYADLLLLCRCGAISDLELQIAYPVHVKTPQGAFVKVFSWICDFRYKDRDGRMTVEDCKGFKTAIYRLKKKCVEAQYGIRILET